MQTNMRLKLNVKDAKLYVFPQNLVNVTGSDVIFGTAPVPQSHLKIDLSRFVPAHLLFCFVFSLLNHLFSFFLISASKLSSLMPQRSKKWNSLRRPSKSRNTALARALSQKVPVFSFLVFLSTIEITSLSLSLWD